VLPVERKMAKLPKFDHPAHLHFVTTNTFQRFPLFLAERFRKIFLANVDHYRKQHRFQLVGYVIMPDHVHLLLGNTEKLIISKTMQLIKYHAAKEIVAVLETSPSWKELGMVFTPAQIERARKTTDKRGLNDLRAPRLEMFAVKRQPSKKASHAIWQESFYDFNVYSEKKLNQKLNYTHHNPVR